MASIVLPLAASSLSSSLGFAAGSLGATAIGLGATLAGSFIDQALFGGAQDTTQVVEGPKLKEVQVQSATEGNPILRCFGFNRIAGQVIWSTRYKENVSTTTSTTEVGGGGKGGGGGGGSTATTVTKTYNYSVSFAVSLCEGEIIDVGRIWVDGKILNLTDVTMRVYKGDQTQDPDPKIVAVEGADFTPAYRGYAYLVFEDFDLSPYGNRIPQMNVEVFSFTDPDGDDLEHKIEAVNIIPSAGEFVYGTTDVLKTDTPPGSELGFGGFDPNQGISTEFENKHASQEFTDFEDSLNTLESACPNLGAASLVVSWYGDDLRVSLCELRPKVEISDKATTPYVWEVTDLQRGSAEVVTQDANGPVLGGTPSDRSVYEAIQDLNDRGIKVMFYPFIFMDVPSGNTLTDPYTGNSGQPVFPWRGRMTTSIAPGEIGTPDKTAAAQTEVDNFVGTAVPGDFGTWDGNTIPYTGPNEWTYRRFILHYAKLCAEAGGVDSFCVGTEMGGLTGIRDSASTFPFVDALVSITADCRTILGAGTKLGYAANWDEYHSYRPTDGSNDVYFHLDSLWSNAEIDFIGIDNYIPISDWRDSPTNIDGLTYDSIYDIEYLKANIEAGEFKDWFYASNADREAQIRTDITDAGGKPWVYGNKAIKDWWENTHNNRPAGVESGSTTSWVAESKPIWFTEFGCPAINKGSNQPNVFYDPKSSESFFPFFSTGARDDFIQRQFLEAHIDYWDPTEGNNPTSSVYSEPMIDTTRMFAWTWDARPFPEFPALTSVWRDGANWQLGHWLNGRLGQGNLAALVEALTADLGVTVDVSQLRGVFTGYVVDRVMSAREALDALSTFYQFDAYESAGRITFRHRGGFNNYSKVPDDLVLEADASETYKLTRAQESELPSEVNLRFIDADFSYNPASIRAKRLIGASNRISNSTLALVVDRSIVQGSAETILMDAWTQRETLSVVLPASMLAVDPTDIFEITIDGETREYRVTDIGYEYFRTAKLTRTDRGLYHRVSSPEQLEAIGDINIATPALVDMLDLPILTDATPPAAPWIAGFNDPWEKYSLFRSPTTSGYELDVVAETSADIGKVEVAVPAGPEDTWDVGSVFEVSFFSNYIPASLEDILVLNGANAAAVKAANGEWEIIQWANAELVSGTTYRLSRLLRGRLGTENAMNSGIPADSEFVILGSLTQTTATTAILNSAQNYKFGPTSKGLDHETYKSFIYTTTGAGFRPYSPVQLKADLELSGDVTLSWLRRTRFPEAGDLFDPGEVPLGEEFERYEIDIYNAAGTVIVRTLEVSDQQSVTYTSTDQTTDRGSGIVNGDSVKFTVYQMSQIYGRGQGRTKTELIGG